MESYFLKLNVHVSRQADGSYMAVSRDFPLLIVAKDLQRLAEKLQAATTSVGAYFGGLEDREAQLVLGELGIELRLAQAGAIDEDFMIPVLVGGGP